MTVNGCMRNLKRASNVFSGLCKYCGKIFYCVHSTSSVCTQQCYVKNRLTDLIRTGGVFSCTFCKKKTYRTKYRAKLKFRNRFCDFKCYVSYKTGRHQKRGVWHLDKDGYKIISVLSGNKCRNIREHRHVMQEKLGRKLEKFEYVHHKNGIKTDNRLENLELCAKWTKSQPPGQRISDLIEFVCKYHQNDVLEHLMRSSPG